MKRSRALRLGILAALVAIAAVLWLRSGGGPTVPQGSTLLLEIAGDYVEAPEAPLLSRVVGDRRQPFAALLSTLAMAARDERLSAVVLRIRNLGIGWGKAHELRGAIGRLRDADIETIAYLELSALSVNREYFVASAADRIYAMPGAALPVVGLAAEYLYLGGLWEKLGVRIEVARVGKYKSAVESLAGRGMSEAAREMANSMLDSIELQFVDAVATSREMDATDVREVIDRAPVLPEELVSAGLIDGVSDLDDLDALQGPVVKGRDYRGVDPATVGFEPVAQFALIYGSGNVVPGRGDRTVRGAPVFAADTISEALADAARDPEIAAIVLRIDSPGGSSLASEVIWQAVRRARERNKPVIASFSDVAASGGYYVAVACDEIVAPPGVLTGSIGVYMLRPVLGEAFAKLGIGIESLTRGRHADFLLSSKPLSPGARQRMESLVLDTYALFVDRVAKGRKLDAERVDAVGQGRVWTGQQALEVGLVDSLGGLHTAVKRGKALLELDEDADVALVPYPRPRSLPEQLAEALGGGLGRVLGERVAQLAASRLPLPGLIRELESLFELPMRAPLLVPPLLIEIH